MIKSWKFLDPGKREGFQYLDKETKKDKQNRSKPMKIGIKFLINESNFQIKHENILNFENYNFSTKFP